MKILLCLFMLVTPLKEYIIIDKITNEELVGVKISTITESLYSDFNGKIKTSSTIEDVQFVSYKLLEIRNDTIFMIKWYD